MRKFCLLMILLVTTLCCACGGNLYEETEKGYTNVPSVEGVCFDMPSSFLSQATAISEINPTTDYRSGAYLYKNGSNKYLLFDINGVIVAVESQTSFDLKNAKDKGTAICNDSICDVWVTEQAKLKYEEQTKGSVYKLVASVNADISITSTLYASCYGKIAVLQYGDYECAMFVGIPNATEKSLTSDQKKTLDHMVKSLTLNMDHFVSPEGSTTPETETVTTDKETESTIPSESEPTVEDTTTETIPEPETEEITSVNSTIYAPLNVGDKGELYALNNSGKGLERTNITLKKLYTGDKAVDIIKKYCETEACPYEYTDAPVGHSWHVIEYTLEKRPEELYVNIKLKGLDGETLKYRGNTISSRTYDIFYLIKETEDGYTKLYCYYAVPNGCQEYLLSCGSDTRTPNVAYYLINDYTK